MNYLRKNWLQRIGRILVLGITAGVASSAWGQNPEPTVIPPAATETEDEDLVAVNLKSVNIDDIVKFLSEITGKAVLKHKDVNVKVYVYSQERVTKKRAFALVSDALLLEDIALVEDRETVRVVPVDKLSEVVVELLPEDAEAAVGGIIKSVIPVEHSDVSVIEELIKPLVSKTGTMLADPASKKIIITDTARRIAAIREVVAEVDVMDTLKRKVRVFELRYATAEEIAPILKSVLSVMASDSAGGAGGGKGNQPPQPQRQPQQNGKQPGGASDKLDVVAYKTANWVVVAAPEEIINAAEGLVEELDRQKPQDLTLHTLFVRFADPEEIAISLRTIFEKQPDKRVQDTVEISSDGRSSSLIILSSQDNFERISELVAELDTEESVQLMTKTYELTYADAEDIAEQMNELYQGLQDSGSRRYYYYSSSRQQDDKTRFVPERRSNSIIAIARPTEYPRIDSLVEQLDVPIDEEQVTPRIFKLEFVDANEVTEVLNKIFGSEETDSSGGYWDYWYGGQEDKSEIGRLYGKVSFATIATSNSIVVTTNNSENFRIIGDFIRELDQISPDAANTIVIKLQNAQASDLASKLNALYAGEGARRAPRQQNQQGNQQQQEQQDTGDDVYYSWLFGTPRDADDKRVISNLIGQVRVVPDMRTNALIITTAPQNFPLLKELVKELDSESPKVLVKVRLIEVTRTKGRRVGVRFGPGSTVFDDDDLDNGLLSNFGFTFADVYRNGTIQLTSGVDLSAVIQFLQRRTNSRILSDTTIAMNNNIPADVFVGARIPFITNSQTTAEGGVVQSFEYKDAGTSLKITPNINELDMVEMKIEMEASQIRPGEILLGGNILDTRQFNTNIAVGSGDTIVIGGIMRESDSDNSRGFPILEKIPVANLAFRKKDRKRETTELIAFITPTVLREPEADVVATANAARELVNINEWRPLPEATTEETEPMPEEETEPDSRRRRHMRHGR